MRRAALAACLLLALSTGVVRAEVEEAEHDASLPELTLASDAVVVGQVVAATRGRSFGGCGYTAATLRVDEVLAGMVPALVPVLTLEYFGWCGPKLPQLGAEIPAERGIFFLRNKAKELRTLKPLAAPAEIDAEAGFWRLAILAGSAVDVGGRVHVPETSNAPFLAALEGQPFHALLDAVRAAAPPRPNAVAARDQQPAWFAVLGRAAALVIAVGAILQFRRRRPI